MIVGDGDIASVLTDREGFLFFASGVSNSQEMRESEYQREADLLMSQNKDLHLVYFSSLAVFEKDTRYFRHKKHMENLVKTNFPKHTIVRIGNITWGTNPRTLINDMRAHPNRPIRDEWRYIVDVDEFLYWINLIPDWNCEMNVPGKRMKIKEVVDVYVRSHTK